MAASSKLVIVFVQLGSSSECAELQGALVMRNLDHMVSVESPAHARDSVTALVSGFRRVLS